LNPALAKTQKLATFTPPRLRVLIAETIVDPEVNTSSTRTIGLFDGLWPLMSNRNAPIRFWLRSKVDKPTWSDLALEDLSNSRAVAPRILRAKERARIPVCENPRFLLFAGEEGKGTNIGVVCSSGQFLTTSSATIGIRLVKPFSFIELMISAASGVYSVIAKPLTPDNSIGMMEVGNTSLQLMHRGEPSLLQITHGVGRTKSRNLDT
jgi:hypothetical protein